MNLVTGVVDADPYPWPYDQAIEPSRTALILIDWQVDGKPFLSMNDPSPLDGPDHAYLGFNNWEVELHFDNLKITP